MAVVAVERDIPLRTGGDGANACNANGSIILGTVLQPQAVVGDLVVTVQELKAVTVVMLVEHVDDGSSGARGSGNNGTSGGGPGGSKGFGISRLSGAGVTC